VMSANKQMQKTHALAAQLKTVHATKRIKTDGERLPLVARNPGALFRTELDGVGLGRMPR